MINRPDFHKRFWSRLRLVAKNVHVAAKKTSHPSKQFKWLFEGDIWVNLIEKRKQRKTTKSRPRGWRHAPPERKCKQKHVVGSTSG